MPPEGTEALTVSDVLRDIARHPGEHLIRRWNWKSAVTSSFLRGFVFFAANFSAGWRAAAGAMAVEFVYRTAISGFYGSVTESFRRAQPPWASALLVMVLLPATSHAIEFGVHYARGTPKLFRSIAASLVFTAVATLFNWYAMRRGVLVVGEGRRSLASDLKAMPGVLADFLLAVPRALLRRGGL